MTTLISPVDVLYCSICSFPPEYCEFSAKKEKCKVWLEEYHPNLYTKYYSDGALEDKMANLTVEQQEAIQKDLEKKARKDEVKAEKEKAKLAASKVIIKQVERNKRKHVTAIKGLENFDVDLKKAAKFIATRFATSASVTKTPQGDDEITVQGDIAYEFEELLLDGDDKKAIAVFGAGKIDGDQIEIIEEKKKKDPAA